MTLSIKYNQRYSLTLEYQQQIHKLYYEHHSWLYSWLRKKLPCPELAADLSQDTFVKLMEHNPVKLLSPRAYLTTISGRLMYDYYRRQSLEKSYLEVLFKLPEEEAPSPQEQLIIQETLQELDALFDSLKPAVRKAFLLSQLEGKTYAEIAIYLNVSLRTVKRYMAKAFEECIMIGVMN